MRVNYKTLAKFDNKHENNSGFYHQNMSGFPDIFLLTSLWKEKK